MEKAQKRTSQAVKQEYKRSENDFELVIEYCC